MSQKPYNSPELDAIRQKIDLLDQQIHDTLMERAELVLKIGEEKRKNNIGVVQPAREARMIRRLLDRHSGALPQMAVVRIWRELVGAVSLLQTGLKVTVAGTETHPAYWDLAKDYFGSCLPMSRSATPLTAIKAVREGEATFAVLPYPDFGPDMQEQPWWQNLELESANPLSIIVRLPHGDDPKDKNPDHKALVISKTGFDTSDDDHSFLLLRCRSDISRGKIVDMFKKVDIEAVGIASAASPHYPDMRDHLIEVEGFINPESESFKAMQDTLSQDDQLFCAGGFPVPPVYSKTIQVTKPPLKQAAND